MILARVALFAGIALGMLQAVMPDADRVVDGRVVRPTGVPGAPAPVAGVWVVLHRVGSDTARPLDSVRTRPDGRFRIAYRAFGAADAIYFVAVRHDGVAYFSAPLRAARVTGADAELTVYDTASAGTPLRERGRHVIIFAPASGGTRKVVEVYEIENTGITTRIAPGGGEPVWRAPIPDAASAFQAGEGDISAASISGGAGKVEVFAPFAPGVKQVSFTYALPPARSRSRCRHRETAWCSKCSWRNRAPSAAGAGLRRGRQRHRGRPSLIALALAERAQERRRDDQWCSARGPHDLRGGRLVVAIGRRDARRADRRAAPRRLTPAAARGSFDAQLKCGCGSRKPV